MLTPSRLLLKEPFPASGISKLRFVSLLLSPFPSFHRCSLNPSSRNHLVTNDVNSAWNEPSGKSSVTIWKLYFLYSVQHQLPQSHIISVFQRAIRSCPWAKGLYLLAFRHLSTILPPLELKRVYEIMKEKELRIHVDLDTFLERSLEGQAAGNE